MATPLRLAPPHWVVDPDFDLSRHLRRLRVPVGGGFPAVIEFARTSGMTAVVSATLEVTATFDPGDGDAEVSVFGPVACTPLGS